MPIITIREMPVNVDVRAELEEFEWHRARWTYNKLIAASPFRYDRSPSFFVRLEPEGDYPAGLWHDSGAYDEDYRSGEFVKLIAFLRNETWGESADYLLYKYAGLAGDKRVLVMPNLRRSTVYKALPESTVTPAISAYLTKRGISEAVQQEARTGYGQYAGFTALPWYTADGRLANVKYRKTRGKAFFYESDAWPIKNLVYGAESIKTSDDPLIICEAEIDALSWRTAGFQAIAIGGVSFSDKQADIIRRLPFETLVLAGDNDKAGRGFNKRVASKMRGVRLATVDWQGVAEKDANEILKTQGPEAMRSITFDPVRIALHLQRGS